METYKNQSKESGVTHYQTGASYIDVLFKGKAAIYRYTNAKTGKNHIDKMKILAKKGKGLSTYISQNPSVKENYILRNKIMIEVKK